MRAPALAFVASLTLFACDGTQGSTPPGEGGASGGMTCGADSDCDDGRYCNGAESCTPSSPSANANGCLAGILPCGAGQTCSETTEACETDCESSQDADGDGHDALACGGDDCDDNDPNRFPGNEEVCDDDAHDEDCDPVTFGAVDKDKDGAPDAACCNVSPSGASTCGTDCNDDEPGIHPTAPETCDGEDNDCDGAVDEGVRAVYIKDADGDGFGSSSLTAERIEACPQSHPEGYAAQAGDCDDEKAAVNPSAREFCDAAAQPLDENCSGTANEGCLCTAGQTAACCGSGSRSCDAVTGEFGPCSITPTVEVCDGADNDCDGHPDVAPGLQCAQGSSAIACMTAGGLAGTRACSLSCQVEDCKAPEVCNGIDDDADGLRDEDFACEKDRYGIACVTACGTQGTRTCSSTCEETAACTSPAETCNYCDDNGSGGILDERLFLVANGVTEGDKLRDTIECGYNATDTGRAECKPDSPGGGADTIELTLLDGTQNFQSGAIWPLQDDNMGWGTIEIEFEIEIRGHGAGYDVNDLSNLNPVPRRGRFSVELTGKTPAGGSTNSGHIGFEYVWGHVNPVQPPNVGQPAGPPANFSATVLTDGLRVYGKGGRFGSYPSDDAFYVARSDIIGGDSWVTQPIYLAYTPDDPSTPLINEEQLLVKAGKDGATLINEPQSTGQTNPQIYKPPTNELPVGAPLSIKISASAEGIPYDARIKLYTLTYPAGPGQTLQTTPHATITRTRLCPYQLGL